MPPDLLVPAELAQCTVESLYAEHGRAGYGTYWMILGGVIAGLGALPLIEVDVSVHARGVVRPVTERTELKVPVSGRVARVLARDNDRVDAGQPVLELDAAELEERLARVRALQRERTDLVADLETLIACAPESVPQSESGDSGAGSPSTTDPPRFRTAVARRDHERFRVQLRNAAVHVAQARTTHDRTVALHIEGLVSQQERDNVQFALQRARAELAFVLRDSLAGWQSRQREEQTSLEQLNSEEKRLVQEHSLSIIRSPATGTLQGLVGVVSGTYVIAGQSLGVVSPDDGLRVEVYVSPKDIGLIRVGQPARLQIDAYPHTRWGMLNAKTDLIGADALTHGTQPVFKVSLHPSGLALQRSDGAVGVIGKGMTATAHIVLCRVNLLGLLISDVRDRLDPRASTALPRD